MARKLAPDKWLFAATTGLALFGVVMVYSASAIMAQRDNGSQFHYVIKQGVWVAIGFGVMLLMMQFNYQQLKNRRIVYGLLVFCTAALLGVFAFSPINGAHRWIKFPGFSMQPSEVSKLALIIFLAYFLEKRAGEEGDFWRTFLPCGLVTALLAGLVVIEPDFGTAMMLVLIFTVVIYTTGARVAHLAMAAAPALVVAAGLLVFVPWRLKRLVTFLDPWADQQGAPRRSPDCRRARPSNERRHAVGRRSRLCDLRQWRAQSPLCGSGPCRGRVGRQSARDPGRGSPRISRWRYRTPLARSQTWHRRIAPVAT